MRIARALSRWIVGAATAIAALVAPQLSAGQVTIAWSPNGETDIAGYKVWYRSAGAYLSLDVGRSTSGVISNLNEGETYTFYATAYNTAGIESSPSTPVKYTVPYSGEQTVLPPVITVQPQNQVLTSGSSLTLSVQLADSTLAGFQWFFNGLPIANAVGQTFQRSSAQSTDAGNYSVRVTNPAGSVLSSTATITVNPLPPSSVQKPVIVTQPLSQSVPLGGHLMLSVNALSATPVACWWFKDEIMVGTGHSFEIPNFASTDAGSYFVAVKNDYGIVYSKPARITVGTGSMAPPTLSISLLGRSGLVLKSMGKPGQVYELQSAEALPTTGWSTVASIIASSTGAIEFSGGEELSSRARFYRLILR
jgi:hypothetical protein